jgi:hypothetical protein
MKTKLKHLLYARAPRKKFTGCVIALVCAFGFAFAVSAWGAPGANEQGGAGGEVLVTADNAADLQDAISTSTDGSIATPTAIRILGDIRTDAALRVPSGAKIKLESAEGGPYSLIANASESGKFGVIEIEKGAALQIANITLRGGYAKTGGGVLVRGTLTMESGATITDNAALGYAGEGGGVYVDKGAAFTMNGGTITGNTAANGAGVWVGKDGAFTMNGGEIKGHIHDDYFGGDGVFADGGAGIPDEADAAAFEAGDDVIRWHENAWSRVKGSVFTMNGGTITGNARGGVNIVQSVFTMNGGKIVRNGSVETDHYGGGVSIYRGIFRMNGDALVAENAMSDSGGGIHVMDGVFEMRGGKIAGNATSADGGGVYADGFSMLTMRGGEIAGNTAGESGGGVYVASNASLRLPADGRIAFSGNKARMLYRLAEEKPTRPLDGAVTQISVPRLNALNGLADDAQSYSKSVFNNFDVSYSTENSSDILDLCDLRYAGISGESLDDLTERIPIARDAERGDYALADGRFVGEADFLWKSESPETENPDGIAIARAESPAAAAIVPGDKLPPAALLWLRSGRDADSDTAVLPLRFSAVSRDARVRSVAGESVSEAAGQGGETKEKPAKLVPGVNADGLPQPLTADAIKVHPKATVRLYTNASFDVPADAVTLSAGENILYIAVTAQDEKTLRYYTATVTRAGAGSGNTGGGTGGPVVGGENGPVGESNTVGGGNESGGESGGGEGGADGGGNAGDGANGLAGDGKENAPGGTNPSIPPRPIQTGGNLTPVPGNGDAYIEIRDDGTPLGEWHYDDEQGEWVFDEYPPPLGDLPQTGEVPAGGFLLPVLRLICGLFVILCLGRGLARRRRNAA